MKNGNGKNPIKKPKFGVGRNPTLIPGNPGNSGGKPGRSGRPTNEFKAEMEACRNEDVARKLREKIRKSDPDDPAWRWAVDRVLEYTTSKAPQKQQLEGGDSPVAFKLDLMAASLARLHE